MPIVVVMAGALAQAVDEGVATLEYGGDSGTGGGGGCGRKWWRTALFWKLRADIRRQVAKMIAAASTTTSIGRNRRGGRGGGRFHYDPFSYALNFDDGVATLFPTLLTIVTTAKAAMLAAAAAHAEEQDEVGAEAPAGSDTCLPVVPEGSLVERI